MAGAANFVVTTTADNGDNMTPTMGSLRDAIVHANANAGTVILFNIPISDPGFAGAAWRIVPPMPLPPLSATTTIDGYSQLNAAPNTLSVGDNAQITIEIDSSMVAENVLTVMGNASTIRGLSIYGSATTAIDLLGGDGIVEGCFIGLRANGTAAGNGTGIIIESDGNRVGGDVPGVRNIISGNQNAGILLSGATASASNNIVQGNYIGTTPAGSAAAGNGSGILAVAGNFSVSANTLGGAAPGTGNVISGNATNGVDLSGMFTTGNSVSGNLIGITADAGEVLGNQQFGMVIHQGAGFNTIGGATVPDGNIISANGAGGILISDQGTMSNDVRCNAIGTDDSGTLDFGNNGVGILIMAGAGQNNVGASDGIPPNLIAFNTLDGISVLDDTSIGNSIRCNAIYNNGGLGIDLVAAGETGGQVTPNDADDSDTGPNGLQNFPVIDSAVKLGTDTTIIGHLQGEPNAVFEIDLFASLAANPSGFGEGEQYLVTIINVMTNATGAGTFQAVVTGLPAGQFITATATDTSFSQTSEFSLAVQSTQAALQVSLNPTTADEGQTSVATVSRTGSTTNAVTVTLSGDAAQVSMPATVDIPAGMTSANFNVDVLDNGIVDGDRTIPIGASATNYQAGADDLNIIDDDTPTLTLSIPATAFSEGAGANAATATLTRNTLTTNSLVVDLASSDTSEATVPATATIPAGQASVNFAVAAVNDSIVDGDQNVTFTASATGFADGMDAVMVTDDDVPTLTLGITPGTIGEGDGPAAAQGTVMRNTDTTNALTVTLASNDITAAKVPSTVDIPAGQASVNFPIDAVDDLVVDGPQVATITASFTGFADGVQGVTVNDDDVPTLTLDITPTGFSENAGAAAATATVTRNTSIAAALTVDLASDDLSEATVPATVMIPAGQASATFAVDAVDDTIVDGDQGVTVTASATGFVDGTAGVTVTDNDVPTIDLSITPTTFSEAAGAGAATGTVTRNTPTANPLTVDLSNSDTSECSVPANVIIPAGQASATFAVDAVDDTIVDHAENPSITASAPGFVGDMVVLTVTDNDVNTLTLDVTPATVSEGAGANAATGTVTRNTIPDADLTVTLTSGDTGEATVPATVIIPMGQFSATFPIDAIDEGRVDGDQNVQLTASAATFPDATAQLLVTDDDVPTLTLGIAPGSFAEGAGPAAATGTVTRNTDTTNPLTVDLASSDTGEAGVPATVDIPAGQASVTFPVDAVNDAVVDGDQGVDITTSVTGFVGDTAHITVTDDDVPTLTLDIAPGTVSEGAGTGAATATVTRNTATTNLLTVTLASDDTTAATVPATVDIPAGQASVTFPVDAVDDGMVDGTQTPQIKATATTFVDGVFNLTVTDDDTPSLTLDIAPATISENAGAAAAAGTVTRNTPPTTSLTVDLASSNVGEATVPANVVIAAGQASATFPIDAVDEGIVDGTKFVTLTGSAAGFSDGTNSLSVLDDDVNTLTLSITPNTISEGAGANAATGTVTRNTTTESAVTVDLASGDTSEATVPATVVIPVGHASATFPVDAIDDPVVDGDQSFNITASAATFVGGSAGLTVTDNDVPTLALGIAPGSINEGAGPNAATGTVTRNTSTAGDLTVDLNSDDTGEAAVAATVIIPAGQASANFAIDAVDDTIVDGDQVVHIAVSASGFVGSSLPLTVHDNDVPTLLLDIAPATFAENAGAAAAVGTVTRNTPIGAALTVNLASSNTGEANVPATVVIPAGQASATFPIDAVDEAVVDGDKAITITGSCAGFAPGVGNATVTDNDVPTLTLTIAPSTISEGDGAGAATATLTRNTDTTNALTVTLASNDTTGATVPPSVDIPVGQAGVTFPVDAVNDGVVDGTQTVQIKASAATFLDGLFDVSVTDDDTPGLTLDVAPAAISENAGSGAATGTVTRNTPIGASLPVSLASSNTGEATVPATVVIPAGQASATFPVDAVDEGVVDGTQHLTLTASAAGFVDGTAPLDVLDDDVPTLTLVISPGSFSEGAGAAAATGTITRNTDISPPLNVTLASDDTTEASVAASVVIPAGAVGVNFPVDAVNDNFVDGDQVVHISVGSAGFVGDSKPVTVQDDDTPTLQLNIVPASVAENAGPGAATGTVTRNTPTGSALLVNLASDDTTEATVPASVTIPNGQASATFPINAIDDPIVDGDQTVHVSANAAGFTGASVPLTVTDNDVPTLVVGVAPGTIAENAGAGAATGTVSRNTPIGASLTVNLASSDTTEAAVTATVIIPAGQASATFPIDAVDDLVVDGDQAVNITGSCAGFASGVGNLTVSDNDVPTLHVDIAPGSISENGGTATVTVSRNTPTTAPLVVDLSSSDTGKASVPATVTIAGGQVAATSTVTGVDDSFADGDHSVLINASASGFVSGSALVTVQDDDAPGLTLSVTPGAISESAGAGAATGTVTRNTPPTSSITVNLTSGDTGEATVPATVVINAGQASATFPIDAVDEGTVDGTQTVTITASLAGMTDGVASVDVLDDDVNTLTLSITPGSIGESAGANAATGTVTRNTSTATGLTVDLASGDTSEATVPATVIIPVGQASATFPIDAVDDGIVDGDQTFNVTASATTFTSGSAGLTVMDNDVPTLTLSIAPGSVGEGAGASAATGTITRNTSIIGALTVDVNNDDTGEATVPATVTIPAGQTSATFPIDAVDEGFVDGDQIIHISVGASTFVGASAPLTVRDDDVPTLTLDIAPATFAENAGNAAAVGTVTRNTSTAAALTVDLSSNDIGEARVPFTVTIPNGQASATFAVSASDDFVVDGDQPATITASSAGFVDGVATVTVTDNDVPTLHVDVIPGFMSENGGTATVTVSRNTVTTAALTVNLASSDTSRATVPATLTIAAGQVSGNATATAVDNDLADGDHGVTIAATASGFIGAAGPVTLQDDDVPTLTLAISPGTIAENAGAGAAIGTVTSNSPQAVDMTVDLSSSDTGEATVPATVIIPASQTTATFPVDAVDDTIVDGTQAVTVTATASGFLHGEAIVNVTNDDVPIISIADTSVTEGDSGAANAVFTITLSQPSNVPVTVHVATADATALAASDYNAAATGPGADVTFPIGSTTQNFTVTVRGDTLNEADETFSLLLSAPVNGVIGTAEGIATILNDDPLPNVSIGNVTVTEGDAGVTRASFSVTLSAVSGRDVTMNFATGDGSAVANADYVPQSDVLIIPAGQTTGTIAIDVQGDTLSEADENFTVTLSNIVNAALADPLQAIGTATIMDNDPLPSLSIADVTVTEGDAGVAHALLSVSLGAASGQTVTVDFTTADGSARQPGDYSANSGTLTFAPGVVTQDVAVPIQGDTLSEADETVLVNLSGAVGATIARPQGVVTIADDDPLPSAQISNASVAEGDSGTTNLLFTVTLSAASGQDVSVHFATADATAASGIDYDATSGNVTIPAGLTSASIAVPVRGDTLNEADETFQINLSSPLHITLANAQAIGTITNDDPLPTVSVGDVTVTEGDSGTINAVFTVSLSAVSGQPVQVSINSGDGTATQPDDYLGVGGFLNIPVGATTATLAVPVNGDLLCENDETFTLTISGPVNAVLGNAVGTCTILDNDLAPTISVRDVAVTEGDAGTADAVFTVGLSGPSGQPIAVHIATADGTAVAGTDYEATSANLQFAPGETQQTFTVHVTGDVLNEANETFFVDLTSPTNTVVNNGRGIGTIVNDDAAPTLAVSNIQVTEGDGGGEVHAVFTATLSAASGQTITANFATADGTATQPADYLRTAGTVTFAPGTLAQNIVVHVVGDDLDEDDENFRLNLTAILHALNATATAQCTILDNDAVPSVSLANTTVAEGNSGTRNAQFVATLTAPSGRAVSFDFRTANGTALAPGDYTAASGTITFAPGATTAAINVPVIGDTSLENDETFFVNLTNPLHCTLAATQAIGTITNDDGKPLIDINSIRIAEGDAGSSTATFTLTLSPVSGLETTVDYATADGTALQGVDYVAASGTVTFPAGVTTRAVQIPVFGDLLDEADETFSLKLANPVNALLFRNTGKCTIVDNDGPPAISIKDAAVLEGNSDTRAAIFVATLNRVSSLPVSVQLQTVDGTALAASDYVPHSSIMTFAPGTTQVQFPVFVRGDTLNEPNETFSVALSSPVNATIARAHATGTIQNDDSLPALSVADTRVAEGDTGHTQVVFTVSLSAASARTVTVLYSTASGTASQPADYLPASGSLTFAPGQTSKTVSVAVVGDTVTENDETFLLRLAGPTNAIVAHNAATATIVNDDAQPVLGMADVRLREGNVGTTNAVFTASLSHASALPVTVHCTTADGTASHDTDYSAADAVLTFAPGVLTRTFNVPVRGDVLSEDNETFTVNLMAATNATLATPVAKGTIVDDDALSLFTISNVAVKEGDSGITHAVFTVLLSAAAGRTVTVDYSTFDEGAVQPGDYTPTHGTLTFAPGVVQNTIDVPVNGDTQSEPNERLLVRLANPVGAGLGTATAACTILDDDGAPANDNFAAAQTLTGREGRATGSNRHATVETGEPNHAGQPPASSVWYRWTAPASGEAVLSTAGSSFDTVLAIYKLKHSTSIAALDPVVSDNDANGDLTSQTNFAATENVTYFIAVASGGGTEGDIVLNWTLSSVAPPNDMIANAATIAGKTGHLDGTNINATLEAGEATKIVLESVNTVWYRWTAPASGTLLVDTHDSQFDTVLAAFDDSNGGTPAIGDLHRLAGDDDSDISNSSKIDFVVVAGHTYFVMVGGYKDNQGEFEFNWLLVENPPANDDIASAKVIGGKTGTETGTNLLASHEPGEPSHAGRPGAASVWYLWTAPATGRVTFDTQGSAFDTLLAVYRATTPPRVDQLTPLIANDDADASFTSALNFGVSENAQYYIVVDGNEGAAGDFVLHWTLTEPANSVVRWNLLNPDGKTGRDGAWGVAANWLPARVPGPGDIAAIDLPGKYTVTLNVDSTVSGISLGTNAPSTDEPALDIAGRMLTLTGNSLVKPSGHINLSAGSLVCDGNLDVTGALSWTGGHLAGIGRVAIASGQLNIADASNGAATKKYLSGVALENNGAAVWNGQGSIEMGSGARLRNFKLFKATSDAVCHFDGVGEAPAFANMPSGSFIKTAGKGDTDSVSEPATEFDGVAFYNSGSVDVQHGILRLKGGGLSLGSFNIPAGSQLQFSSAYLFDKDHSKITGTGHICVLGGTVELEDAIDAQRFEVCAGTLTGIANLTASTEFVWEGGKMSGKGKTIAGQGATFSIQGDDDKTLDGRTLINNGDGSWTGSGELIGSGGATFQNFGTLDTEDGATFSHGSGDDPEFENDGTFNPGGSPGGTFRVRGGTRSVALGTGLFTLFGNFNQRSTGLLNVDIAGHQPGANFDQLNIHGNATLNGTINVRFATGFTPQPGDSFTIVNFESHNGNVKINFQNVPPGLEPQASITDTGIIVSLTSTASSTFSIAGRVVDGAGNPLAGIRVERSGTAAANSPLAVLTAKDGTYLFPNLKSGTYIVAPAFASIVPQPASRNVVLTTANATVVNFQLNFAIGGRVFGGNAGLAGIVVRRIDSHGNTADVTSDAHGYYAFAAVSPGTYGLSPVSNNWLFNFVSVTVSGAGAQVANFEGTSLGGGNAANGDSSLRLSSGAAIAATQTIELKFTGGLDADTVAAPEHYEVVAQTPGKGPRIVEIESVSYRPATQTVVVGVGSGSLAVGDQVTVTWRDLRDSKGLTVAGRSSALTVH